MYIDFKGNFVRADEPVFTADNRSFRYGDGLFESMRFMNGDLRFAEWHAERLQRGMSVLKMEGADAMTANFLRERAAALVARNRLGAHARLRFTVYRDSGGLYSPENNRSAYVAEAAKVDAPVYKASSRGFIAELYTEIGKPVNILSNFKTCNSMLFVMAGLFRKEQSLDEVILLNHNGYLCEALTSNLFVVHGGNLYTPSLAEGCIDGVMRRVVIQVAREAGITVEEGRLHTEILNGAEEVFITNAARGIQWLMGIGGRRYFNEMSKLLVQKLNEFEVLEK